MLLARGTPSRCDNRPARVAAQQTAGRVSTALAFYAGSNSSCTSGIPASSLSKLGPDTWEVCATRNVHSEEFSASTIGSLVLNTNDWLSRRSSHCALSESPTRRRDASFERLIQTRKAFIAILPEQFSAIACCRSSSPSPIWERGPCSAAATRKRPGRSGVPPLDWPGPQRSPPVSGTVTHRLEHRLRLSRKSESKLQKKPTWPNTLRHSTTSAYSLTSLPAKSGCSLSSHPTNGIPRNHTPLTANPPTFHCTAWVGESKRIAAIAS